MISKRKMKNRVKNMNLSAKPTLDDEIISETFGKNSKLKADFLAVKNRKLKSRQGECHEKKIKNY